MLGPTEVLIIILIIIVFGGPPLLREATKLVKELRGNTEHTNDREKIKDTKEPYQHDEQEM